MFLLFCKHWVSVTVMYVTLYCFLLYAVHSSLLVSCGSQKGVTFWRNEPALSSGLIQAAISMYILMNALEWGAIFVEQDILTH